MTNLISVVVLAKNEEKNLGDCLDYLQWADEILVVDDNSTDKTVEIAKSRGARVITHSLNDNFANQRNLALKKTKNDWVLFVDADEIITPDLAEEIVRRVKRAGDNVKGFYIPRKTLFFDQKLRMSDKPSWNWSCQPQKLIRLANKNFGFWEGSVHEIWNVKGKLGSLSKPIWHKPFTDIDEALIKINYYSSLEAARLYENDVSAGLLSIVCYPVGKFFKNYLWHKGVLDGTAGLAFCLIMSMQSFLVRAKLWHKNQRK